MWSTRFLTAGLFVCCVFSMPGRDVRADVILSNGGGGSAGSTVPGQSMTTPAGGPWDNITFHWRSGIGSPLTDGTLYILDQEYLGAYGDLSTATPGFLAKSQSIVSFEFVFNPTFTLEPATQYFFYSDANHAIGVSADTIPGNRYQAVSTNFEVKTDDAAFVLDGTVVPEPCTIGLAGVAVVMLVGPARRRRRP